MKKVIYVHGKGGNAAEAEHFGKMFADYEVVGFDYKSQSPQEARDEFPPFFTEQRNDCEKLILVANSIGAFFSMSSLGKDVIGENVVDEAYFISPVVDMENLICNMMTWAGVTESELAALKEIPTNFGETLSWEYLCYVRNNPIKWNVKTHILYGEKDNLTPQSVITGFAEKIGASLEIMPGGEHWFHTGEQMKFLDDWLSGKK